MDIRAVLFDLDNTLTHRDQSIDRYAEYLAGYYALDLQPNQTVHMGQIIRRIDQGGYPDPAQLTQPSIAASVAEALLDELKWHRSPSLADLTTFWQCHFALCAVPMTGAKRVLTCLKKAGYALAVVSNGAHASRLNLLHSLDVHDIFDVVHSSGLLGMRKPHTEIFLHTARVLQLEPAQCLFVGDHPVNDIQGAQQAGMQALWLAGFHPQPRDIQMHGIAQLSQILEYLALPSAAENLP